jgi:transcriptional regulator with GAF, ATPase, and Fis domain
VGGSKTLSVDVRVIAATNRELDNELAEGRFRPDLFYRLNVYPITVPTLRSRKEDIPLLVNHFVSILNSQAGKTFSEITPQVLEELQAYHWPGNVRELRNVIERAVISCPEPVLFLAEKMAAKDTVSTRKETSKAELLPLKELERRHIQRVLSATKGRISGPLGAATILDINPSTLRFRMKKLGIKK